MSQAIFHSQLLCLITSESRRVDLEAWASRLRWQCRFVSRHIDLFTEIKKGSYDLLILDEIVDGGNSLLHLPEIRELSPKSVIASISPQASSGDQSALFEGFGVGDADHVLKHDFGRSDLEAILIQVRYHKLHEISPNHILVIDDCRDVRKAIMKTLKGRCYRVSQARSAEEAFGRADLGSVDVIMTDIFMPGMGGIKAIQKFKQFWPQIALIAMSDGGNGIEASQVLKAAQKVGADAALIKPFDEPQLISQIEAVLKVRYLAA